MLYSRRTFAGLMLLAGVGFVRMEAASPVPWTTITVHNMHCADCAKQIARKLYAVPGVVEVRADVGKNIAYVVPQKDKAISPKSLWTAVESAGFQVARLESPQGTYTARPTR